MAREREEGGGLGAHPLLIPCVVLAHLVILTAVFWQLYTTKFSDVPIYYDYASKLLAGRIPYRDFAMEYPPAALVFFALPRFVGSTIVRYYIAFRVEVIVFDLLIVLALNAIARRRGLNRATVLVWYTLFVLTVGPIVGQDFDIFPAATVVFALFFAGRGEWDATAIMLGVGIATKLYPVLLVPVFAMPFVERRDLRRIGRAAVVTGTTVLVICAPLLVAAPASLPSFLRYHSARGVHVESTYGSLLLLADKLGVTRIAINYNFGSWNLSGTAPAAVKLLSSLLLLATMMVVYTAMFRRTPRDDADAMSDIADWSALTLLAALVASKVLSPQYLIWLMPLLPLLSRPSNARRSLWLLFALAGVVTYYIFPEHYVALVLRRENAVVAALLIRNLLLVSMTVLLFRALRRGQRDAT